MSRTGSTSAALAALRPVLLDLKPAAADGFEGLIATTLAAVTGQVVRLARSGLQFGRDMRSGNGDFAIAAECKRYDAGLRLEDLAGKAMLAGRHLSGKADLWLLCATSEIGEATVDELTDLLYDQGVSMVSLDWPAAGLPPLAVFLAMAEAAVDGWFAAHRPADRRSVLRHLAAVRTDSGWTAARDALAASLDRAEAGLGPLRAANAAWLRARLADPDLARDSFGQVIGITPAGLPAVARQALSDELAGRIRAPRTGPALVVVTGEEGVGKTWLVARWWAADAFSPILLLVAGRRARLLDPASPLKSLARLLADEAGRDDDRAMVFWLRRLERWKTEPAAGLRFLLVVDGLNEHAGEAWSDMLRGLARELDALGGIVCVTSRQHYWKRDVEPRLRTAIERRRIDVPLLSDGEVDGLVRQAGPDPTLLAPSVRAFLRAPRVCVVALRLIGSLALAPENLTIDRLLMDYWRDRLAERGNLIHHGVGAFHNLLKSHARAWREAPRRDFERAQWQSHSGMPADARRDLADDLTEIEEGRFMAVNPADEERYSFRPEVLPFALALLLNDELRQRMALGETPHEVIDQIIGPVEAFDELSRVIASAIAMGCSEQHFPPAGLLALIDRFTALQNVENDAGEAVLAHLRERVEPFLDLLEAPAAQLSGRGDPRVVERLLLVARDAPKVAEQLTVRIPRWLGQWSREARAFGEDADKQRARHLSRIDVAFTAMTLDERRLFDRLGWETEYRPVVRLEKLAAHLLAGRPIAPVAAGVAGFGLADFAADALRSGEALAWTARFNRIDGSAVAGRLDEILAGIDEAASDAMRRGAALALRVPGGRDAARRAARLLSEGRGEMLRMVERYCETNPFDPAAARGDNLPEAISSATDVKRAETWSTYHRGEDDHLLEMITPALARFDIAPLVAATSQVVATAPERTGLALRQLGLRMPEMGALLDPSARRALDRALTLLAADRGRLDPDDVEWIYLWIHRAVTAHETAEQQLDRLIALPAGFPLYLDLREEMRPLPADQVASRLAAAHQAGGLIFQRTLFFLTGHRYAFDARSGEVLVEAFVGDDADISTWAADILLSADDSALFARLLDRLEQGPQRVETGEAGYARGRTIARAVMRCDRTGSIGLVPPRFLGEVAAALGGVAIARFLDHMDMTMAQLARPAMVDKPADIDLVVGVGVAGHGVTRWANASAEPDPADAEEAWRRFADHMNQGLKEASARFEHVHDAAEAYRRELDAQGLSDIGNEPSLDGLAALGAAHAAPLIGWLERILAPQDAASLAQQRNMGVALAGALAPLEPELTARAMQRLRDVAPPVAIVYGDHRVPLYEQILYRLPCHPLFDRLRAEAIDGARDDRALGRQARFADALGAASWLDGHITALTGADVPADIARGLFVAGLRILTDRTGAVLDAERGPGFLGWVADSARDHVRHLAWSRHWLSELGAARDPISAWRAMTLAEKLVDLRFLASWPDPDPSWSPFAGPGFTRLVKAAERREDGRKKTLFGQRAPSALFWMMYEDAPDGD